MVPGYKKTLLFLLSVGSICLISKLPPSQDWLRDRIIPRYTFISDALDNMAPEQRRALRYGDSYAMSLFIKQQVLQSPHPEASILLPSKGFLQQQGLNLSVPEPITFYYYTGLRALWPNSSDAASARWIVQARREGLRMVYTENPKEIQAAITEYKKYPIEL